MTTAPAALRLPRSLTHDVASSLTAAAAQAVQSSGGAGSMTVDASDLSQFDSSALAVLLDCRRQALAAGHSFAVTGMPARLLQLATLYGVGDLISGTSTPVVRPA